MKYMGSKRSMLANGLGEAIAEALPKHRRFADLFTGSGAVAWYVARNYNIEVYASDLQQFAVVLASSVISRTKPMEETLLKGWYEDADNYVRASSIASRARKIQNAIDSNDIGVIAERARALCFEVGGPIVNAYGGYYFSPWQALYLDALRATLPRGKVTRDVCLASLIWAASRCAASPGHTAQPFKPNASAGIYLREAWLKDIRTFVHQAYLSISQIVSLTKGRAEKIEASLFARELSEGDLAFVDPPYSGVHYSRFYHVLETLASNSPVKVSGTGRYPPREMRPQSEFSVQTSSQSALLNLFRTLANSGCSAIVTFPAGDASNGLSGRIVRELARSLFKIKSEKVTSRFSTLGGNLVNRDARHLSQELILTLTPKSG